MCAPRSLAGPATPPGPGLATRIGVWIGAWPQLAWLDAWGAMEDDDPVGAADRGQAMRDHDGGAAGEALRERGLHAGLGLAVDLRGGLVEVLLRLGPGRAARRDSPAGPPPENGALCS